MTGSCGTCNHWQRCGQYERGFRQGLGRCAAVMMFWDCTEWNDDGENVFKAGHENIKAFVQDGSDYRADLLTRPDFGCVSWVAK